MNSEMNREDAFSSLLILNPLLANLQDFPIRDLAPQSSGSPGFMWTCFRRFLTMSNLSQGSNLESFRTLFLQPS